MKYRVNMTADQMNAEVTESIRYGEDPVYCIVARNARTKAVKRASGIEATQTFWRAIRELIHDGYEINLIEESDESKTHVYTDREISDTAALALAFANAD